MPAIVEGKRQYVGSLRPGKICTMPEKRILYPMMPLFGKR
ncbi:hypothetical protein PAECIP111802_04916 [Paenibacillus allorhizosphaerae]|uniref:Uncharacterized protein n=1 Tax=Paenibacillus allorhizosphaerae TaxID=2849866 RepID=A0ABN7TQC6_9BACL|nr:hypothetical protein PAECIP111802_04916 [Paenibacillus allorhizosphaerae]